MKTFRSFFFFTSEFDLHETNGKSHGWSIQDTKTRLTPRKRRQLGNAFIFLIDLAVSNVINNVADIEILKIRYSPKIIPPERFSFLGLQAGDFLRLLARH